jgi:hypothetical protein
MRCDGKKPPERIYGNYLGDRWSCNAAEDSMGGKAPMNSEDQNRNASDAEKGDWRRIHHSPVFWVGIVLCLAAIAIYVWSDDLSWRPRVQ